MTVVSIEDLETITQSVWSTMLDDELGEARPGPVEASYVGVVRLSGAFEGAVSLHLSAGVVRRAAALLFSASPDEVGDESVRDSVAELTNMVGGNVKCLVPQPTKLGLPDVAKSVPELPPTLAHVAFDGDGGRIAVVLHGH